MKHSVLTFPRTVKPVHLNLLMILSLVSAISLLYYQARSIQEQQPPKQQILAGNNGSGQEQTTVVSPVPYDVVFVSRKIVKHGANDMDTLTDMPGVGPHSRFRDCAPGKLLKYRTNGKIVTLIDGNNPTAATLNLIDVNAPDVSYDGTKIVFAGLPAPAVGQTYDTLPKGFLGAWRIYKINVNGTGLTQLTNSDLIINVAQFTAPGGNQNNLAKYDDIDPIWMPDGRICFSSSRWPSFAEYGGSRTTNLYVMNSNGTNMHRITSERNGAERPMIDPLTGQIVFSRWWRNGRFPLDDMTTLANTSGTGYFRKDGLSYDGSIQSVLPNLIHFNGWVAAAINPDGTGLHLFTGGRGDNQEFMMYGGSFTSTNDLVSNYFPENKLSPEGGFGGVNKHVRGIGVNEHLAGLTFTGGSGINAPPGTPDSLLRFFPIDGFASDAHVLPDDRIIISWAPNYNQDYGLYVINADGTNKTLLYDKAGTTQLRAKAIHSRTLAPVITDQVTQVASIYPPLAAGPYNTDGTFTFSCLNVYANGPVDMDITSAPAIGSATSIRFFINHQRTRRGSDSQLDWPILLAESAIPPSGVVNNPNSPANVPLFEQLRTSSAQGYVVPTTGAPFANSTSHVAGMNYGRPGQIMTCVGCHRGHSMLPVPANQADAEFTNLAPGATVTISSGTPATIANFLTDRKVMLAFADEHYWFTPNNMTTNQWAKLTFPVSIKINKVRLYNIPLGGTATSSLQVHQAQVNLYADANATQLVGTQTISQDIASTGTDVAFSNVVARCVEIKILNVTGTFTGKLRAGLAEVEVIASGNTVTQRLATAEVDNNVMKVELNPNPVKDVAHLVLQPAEDGKIIYAVYNTSGTILLKKELAAKKDLSVDELIDLSGKPYGIYFVRVESANFKKVFKLIKM